MTRAQRATLIAAVIWAAAVLFLMSQNRSRLPALSRT